MHFQSQPLLCLSCSWTRHCGLRMPVSGKGFKAQVVSGYVASPMMYMPISWPLRPYILLWKELSSFCQFPYGRQRTLCKFPGCLCKSSKKSSSINYWLYNNGLLSLVDEKLMCHPWVQNCHVRDINIPTDPTNWGRPHLAQSTFSFCPSGILMIFFNGTY